MRNNVGVNITNTTATRPGHEAQSLRTGFGAVRATSTAEATMALLNAQSVRKRDKTHWLYLAVIAAVAAGIVVGLAAPGTAVQLKPLGDSFVSLVKMMISPIIFCTV